jgi:hypothetical protein
LLDADGGGDDDVKCVGKISCELFGPVSVQVKAYSNSMHMGTGLKLKSTCYSSGHNQMECTWALV